MIARIKGGTLSKLCFSAEQKVRSQYCGCELKNTRKALPESFIVGLCLIFELELDIDFDLKVLIGTKRTSKNWEHRPFMEIPNMYPELQLARPWFVLTPCESLQQFVRV